jgi:hypothetical protein
MILGQLFRRIPTGIFKFKTFLRETGVELPGVTGNPVKSDFSMCLNIA